jgi:hypothetical protein
MIALSRRQWTCFCSLVWCGRLALCVCVGRGMRDSGACSLHCIAGIHSSSSHLIVCSRHALILPELEQQSKRFRHDGPLDAGAPFDSSSAFGPSARPYMPDQGFALQHGGASSVPSTGTDLTNPVESTGPPHPSTNSTYQPHFGVRVLSVLSLVSLVLLTCI